MNFIVAMDIIFHFWVKNRLQILCINLYLYQWVETCFFLVEKMMT